MVPIKPGCTVRSDANDGVDSVIGEELKESVLAVVPSDLARVDESRRGSLVGPGMVVRSDESVRSPGPFVLPGSVVSPVSMGVVLSELSVVDPCRSGATLVLLEAVIELPVVDNPWIETVASVCELLVLAEVEGSEPAEMVVVNSSAETVMSLEAVVDAWFSEP